MNPDIFNVLDGVKVLRESEVRQIVREEIVRHMARDLPSAIDDAVESGMTKGIMKILWAAGILIDIDALKGLISYQDKLYRGQLAEVVRCRDCKHFRVLPVVEGVSCPWFCECKQSPTLEEDFCSRGERRSEDD